MRNLLFVSLLLLALPAAGQNQRIITTVAGTDLVFGGDGQPAISRSFGRISRVTIDPNGRPVFADPNFHLIFRVETSGAITVIAGNNVQGLKSALSGVFSRAGGGFSGDGGPATQAALNHPQAVAYDAAGNLYISDTFNQRIRMVNPQGIITTIAGTGKAGFSGDGGPATSAQMSYPVDLAIDGTGNLYFSDNLNYRIRRINAQGVISTVVGTGLPGNSADGSPALSAINDVEGLAVDAAGVLYFSDFPFHRVRKVSSGNLVTVAGNGTAPNDPGDGKPATAAAVAYPAGLTFDANGNLLIVDAGHTTIRKLTTATGILTTIGGTSNKTGFAGDGGQALGGLLHNPFGIAAAKTGEIYVADRDNYRIRKIDTQGGLSSVAGNGRLFSSQDGLPANQVAFYDPFGIRVDNRGNFYIADTDNNLIRRLNPDGTVSLFAGSGAQESSGDNGPALQAGVLGPFSAWPDTVGNVFEADANGQSIRKITASGSIVTLVSGISLPTDVVSDAQGNLYIADFAGNRLVKAVPGGQAAAYPVGLNFSNPAGLSIDAAGNLYVAEFSGGRVSRVSPSGNVSVIAGGGSLPGVAADGGPATSAQLNRPSGVVVDNAGVVYFSDAGSHLVRRVDTAGVITTVAGNGSGGYSGDGGPATSAALNGPWGLTIDSAGALYISDVLNNRIRKVWATAPTFSSDQTVQLTAASNGAASPVGNVTLQSSLPGLLFSASSAQSWMQISTSSGAMPATLQISADPTGLAPGSYSGTVTISAPGANPPSRTVSVYLTVNPATAAAVATDISAINVSVVAGAQPVVRTVNVHNAGSGVLSYNVTSSVARESGWLGISSTSGTATANTSGATASGSAPTALFVTITPGQLGTGTYTGTLTVANANGSDSSVIPVNLTIADATQTKLLLTDSGLTFQASAGGGQPLPKSFGILNAGQGSMPWSAKVTPLSGGSAWLSISPSSGTVASPSDVSQRVAVSANASGLAAGTYYARVDITTPNNSPQSAIVSFSVRPAGTPLSPEVYPTSLLFTSTPGSSPGSQTISISNLGTQSLNYSAVRNYTDSQNANWLATTPANGVVAPNQPASIVVQPDFSSLKAGVYESKVSVQFGDGSPAQSVRVLAIPTSGVGTSKLEGREANCVGQNLTIALANGQSPLKVAQSQTTNLDVVVTDACGPVTATRKGSVVFATFSNADPQRQLASQAQGKWTAQWQPQTANSVTITFFAFVVDATGNTTGQKLAVTANVGAKEALTPPLINGGVQNGASFVSNAPVAPGSLITIKGDQLATSSQAASSPFPPSLAGTQVLVGGKALPLLYASGAQINAQVPTDLAPNTQHQIIVQRDDGALSQDSISVGPASPAIFTMSQDGKGQGAILNGVTNVLADPSAPVTAGDVIVIYCTGLGATNPSIPAGQPAPLDKLSFTVNPVTATVGGISSTVLFAGLAPGFAGLYQVNVVVPQGLTPGGQVPVVLQTAGQSSQISPPVTIAVR